MPRSQPVRRPDHLQPLPAGGGGGQAARPSGGPTGASTPATPAPSPTWSSTTSTASRCGPGCARDRPLPIAQAVAWGRQLADSLAYLHDLGHRPPGPEAGERPGHPRRPPGHHRLRHRPPRGRPPPDLEAPVGSAGHARLHEPRAGPGRPGRRPQRRLRLGRDDVRDAHRPGPVSRGQQPGRDGRSHEAATPSPFASCAPRCPPALEAVVMHAMRRYPEHRYATAAELLDDLDRLDTLDPARSTSLRREAHGRHGRVRLGRRLWAWVAMIAFGFLGIVAVILALSVVLRCARPGRRVVRQPAARAGSGSSSSTCSAASHAVVLPGAQYDAAVADGRPL